MAKPRQSHRDRPENCCKYIKNFSFYVSLLKKEVEEKKCSYRPGGETGYGLLQ